MIFSLIHAIYFLITLILKLLIWSLKLIYKTILVLIKLITFILTNNYLRFPAILCILGIIFSTNFTILATIYFIYLINKIAQRNNIYYEIKRNIISYIHTLKEQRYLVDLFSTITSDFSLIHHTLLDDEGRPLLLHYLIITDTGLYNIIPASINNSLYDCDFHKLNLQIIHLQKLISDVIPTKITITNILASSTSGYLLSSDLDPTIIVLHTTEIPSYIQNDTYNRHLLSIKEVNDLILENKMWLFDRLFITITNFLIKNKKVIEFFILSPIAYSIYIFIIIITSRAFTILAAKSIDAFLTFLNL